MAHTKQIIIVLASLMLIGLVSYQAKKQLFSQKKTTVSDSSQVEYSYYVFATEWAGAVCDVQNCYLPSAADFFNLHGLWPSNQDKNSSPMSCSTDDFSFNSLPTLEQQQADVYWSGLYNSQAKFLSHEWSKHGTCWNPFLGDLDRMDSHF